MIRQECIIPKLSKTFIPRRFLFFDTETYDVRMDRKKKMLAFRLGVALYVEYDPDGCAILLGDHTFRDPLDFVELLARYGGGPTTLYAVAHNIQFDLQTLDLPYLVHASGMESELPILSFGATLWKVHYRDKPIHFIDSMNLFPGKLEELGQSVGVPKLKVSFQNDPDAKIIEYCRNDCAILLALFTQYRRFLVENDLGYFGETIAWQAMNAFRHRFMSVAIHIHCNYEVLNQERKAYHGARCECFRIGEMPEAQYTMLDVNSMYPYVMHEYEYPVQFLVSYRNPVQRVIDQAMRDFYCIAEVELDTDEPAYPLRTTTKLVFPVGTYTTWLHHCEIAFALRRDHCRGLRSLLCYRKDKPFTDYVEFFDAGKQASRAAGQRSEELMWKRFEVSLYGKWGQKNHILHMLGNSDRPGIHCELVGRDGVQELWEEWDWYGKRYSSVKLGERPYSSPVIAGAITAYGRMYLWQLKEEAGHDQTFYVDTDSLIVTEIGRFGLAHLLDDTRLGSLKQVWRSDRLTLFGPKDYAVDGSVKRKGVRAGGQTFADGSVESEQWSHLGPALKHGEHGPVVVRQIVKRRKTEYDKGRVDERGYVTPWRLPEDRDKLP